MLILGLENATANQMGWRPERLKVMPSHIPYVSSKSVSKATSSSKGMLGYACPKDPNTPSRSLHFVDFGGTCLFINTIGLQSWAGKSSSSSWIPTHPQNSPLNRVTTLTTVAGSIGPSLPLQGAYRISPVTCHKQFAVHRGGERPAASRKPSNCRNSRVCGF